MKYVQGDDTGAWATFSADERHRFLLGRRWAPPETCGPWIGFVMLNPSTADAFVLDPTLRRCRGFAQREGFGGMVIANLFALRATRPVHLLSDQDDAFGGADQREAWRYVLDVCGLIVCAWGSFMDRGDVERYDDEFLELARLRRPDALRHLGLTKSGRPRHPLYLRADAPMEPFE